MRWGRSVVVGLLVVLAACGGGGDDDGDEATFCTRLDRLTDNDPFRAFGATATAAEIEQAFTALVERADELVDVAPPEARGAADDFATSAAAMRDVLAEAGFDGATVDTRAYRDAQLTYAEASTRLLRYLDTTC